MLSLANILIIKSTTNLNALKCVVRNTRNISLSRASNAIFKVQDDKDFIEKVEGSKEPVIVDFFATWCGPCKALEPRLENIMAKRHDKITLAKVDIDSLGEIAAKYDVATIPSLMIFKNGKVESKLVGLQDEDKLGNWVDQAIEDK